MPCTQPVPHMVVAGISHTSQYSLLRSLSPHYLQAPSGNGLSSFKARSISFTLLLPSHDLGAIFRHLMPSPLSRYPIAPPKTPRPSLTRWSFETYSKPHGSSKSAQAIAESRTKNYTDVRKPDVSSPSKSLRGRDSFRKIYCTLYGAGIVAHTHSSSMMQPVFAHCRKNPV
jgi:hypothetical protein